MIRIARNAPVALALIALLMFAGSASADTTSPFWTCRGSVGYLGSADPSQPRLEPMVAHANSADPCANDDAGQNQPIEVGDPSKGKITIQSVYAGTRIKPAVASSDIQKVAAVGQTSAVRIQNADQSFVMTADVTQASVNGSCNGGVPAFGTSGGVTKAVINGREVPTDEVYQQTGNGLNGSPFGQVTRVTFNEVTTSGTTTEADQSATRRAIHVEILDGNGRVVFTAVVAEAMAGRHGPVCQAGPRCPQGAIYDPQRNVCVIREETPANGACPPDTTKEGDVCVRTTVVGPQPGQSTGGKVVPLGDVKGYRGPCKNPRFGSQVAIIGTNHGDRITGSNKSDRIFVFGGNDKVSGGRGNECIEGGTGSDQLDGSTGSDWLLGGAGNDQTSGGPGNDYQYGGAGNDKLIGGSGNDHLYGGAGRNKLDGGKGNDLIIGGPDRDYIVGGNGRDRIRSGKGNDDINVATAGSRAKVDCGAGVDTVRINNNELRSIKHCERVLVTTRLNRLKSYDKAYEKNKR